MRKRVIHKKPKAKKTRKGLVKVEGYLNPKYDLPIKLEITATPEGWESFKYHVINSSSMIDEQEKFFKEMFDITGAALKVIRTQPRGKHKKRHDFVEGIKEKASVLYPFVKFWCKQPVKNQHRIFKGIIEMARKEKKEFRLKNIKAEYDPSAITAYCLERLYGEKAKKMGLNPFFDDGFGVRNFYFTYIKSSRTSRVIEKYILKIKQPEGIDPLTIYLAGEAATGATVINSRPLNELLKSLLKIF